jgi:hypothetical protein
MPWAKSGMIHQDGGILTTPATKPKKKVKVRANEDNASNPRPEDNNINNKGPQ